MIQDLPIARQAIEEIAGRFGLTFQQVTRFVDTSHGAEDIRWNLMLDDRWVLKINSHKAMWEDRLQEIARLVRRYRSIGLYAPGLVPALTGSLSCQWPVDGQEHTCFVEEYAQYPTFAMTDRVDHREVVEHLGLLAARYTNVDLSHIHSMWSIIALSPLDGDVDEKQENTDMLVAALKQVGQEALAERLNAFNDRLRQGIQAHFEALPRCVFQGDLNHSNLLNHDGHFAGLIDFNCSGTDVNINVFVNETNWFPETEDLDAMTVPQLLRQMESHQAQEMAVILGHYRLSPLEEQLLPNYQRIADLFQYPNACQMVRWLKDEARRDRCVALIEALMEKPIPGLSPAAG